MSVPCGTHALRMIRPRWFKTPRHLRRSDDGIRGEDDSEDRHDGIHTAVIDGERGRVTGEPSDVRTVARSLHPGHVEQSRGRIDPSHASTACGGEQGRVPGPAAQVENVLTLLQRRPFDDNSGDRQEPLGCALVSADAPIRASLRGPILAHDRTILHPLGGSSWM